MNVLMHFNGEFSENAGVSRCVIDANKALLDNGIKTTLLYGYGSKTKTYLNPLRGFFHLCHHSPLTALFFANAIKGKDFDIVHSHTPEAAFDAVISRMLLGKKYRVVVHLHGLDRAMRKEWKHEVKNGIAKYSLRQELYLLASMFKSWFAFKLADEFIAVSSRVAEQANLFYGIEPVIIQNSIDCSSLKKIPKKKAKTELGLANKLTVLFVGNASWVKGLNYLADAVSKIKNAKLVVVGMKKNEETSLLLGDNVSFEGTVPRKKLGVYYSAADVLCVPSVYEGFGLMFAEAQCFNLPCIGCNKTGAEETIENNANGFLVKKRSVEEIVNALKKIKKLRFKKKNIFSPAESAKKIINVYNGVIE